MSKTDDKCKEIGKYFTELAEIVPTTFEEYTSNNLMKAGCERYVERIVEAATDIAFMIMAKKKFRIPEDDFDAFRILFEHKVIDEELCKKLKQTKGMRNIIAHAYGKVDDAIVFEAVTGELEKGMGEFIGRIQKYLSKAKKESKVGK